MKNNRLERLLEESEKLSRDIRKNKRAIVEYINCQKRGFTFDPAKEISFLTTMIYLVHQQNEQLLKIICEDQND